LKVSLLKRRKGVEALGDFSDPQQLGFLAPHTDLGHGGFKGILEKVLQ